MADHYSWTAKQLRFITSRAGQIPKVRNIGRAAAAEFHSTPMHDRVRAMEDAEAIAGSGVALHYLNKAGKELSALPRSAMRVSGRLPIRHGIAGMKVVAGAAGLAGAANLGYLGIRFAKGVRRRLREHK